MVMYYRRDADKVVLIRRVEDFFFFFQARKTEESTEQTAFKLNPRSSHHGSVVKNLSSIHENTGSVPAHCVKGSGVAVSCDIWCRHSLDLWHRPVATALI